MTRIPGGGIAHKNPFGPTWTTGTKEAGSLADQVEHELFGKKKPKLLDVDDADVATQMGRLHGWRKKLARLAGDAEDDYDLRLCEGTIALIDQQGVIFVGKSFLLAHADNLDLLVGVLAHEIGHRPQRWHEYRSERPRNKDEIEHLCRLEETHADYFAGRALAAFGFSADPICAFLEHLEEQPHPEYFPAAVRGEVIREGFADGRRKDDQRKKMFPELHKHLGGKHDLGSG